MTVLHFDRDMSQFLVLAKQCPVRIGGLGIVSYDRDDRRKFSRGDLPDMKIGNARVTVALNGAANLGREIRRLRCAIEWMPLVSRNRP